MASGYIEFLGSSALDTDPSSGGHTFSKATLTTPSVPTDTASRMTLPSSGVYWSHVEVTVTGTGEQRRDFTHIDDIVDGLYKCIGKNFKADIFELGRGKNFSINEVADLFNWKKVHILARNGEYDRTLCDYTNAKEKLGWEPTRNLEEYIANVI